MRRSRSSSVTAWAMRSSEPREPLDRGRPVLASGEGARRQALEGRPDREDVLDLLGPEPSDVEATARGGDQQALLLELTHRLAERSAADLELFGQLGLDHRRLRRQLSAGDGRAQRGQRLLAQVGLGETHQARDRHDSSAGFSGRERRLSTSSRRPHCMPWLDTSEQVQHPLDDPVGGQPVAVVQRGQGAGVEERVGQSHWLDPAAEARLASPPRRRSRTARRRRCGSRG